MKKITKNIRMILSMVNSGEASTRADLTALTGLTAQSVSRITEQLVKENLLIMGKPVRSGERGQPSPSLEVNPNYKFSIGLSIATFYVAVTVVDFAGNIILESYSFDTNITRAKVIAFTEEHIQMLREKHNVSRNDIIGIGVAISGYFIGHNESVNPPVELEDFAISDFKGIFEKKFNFPVFVENDGSAAAVGEAKQGVGKKYSTFGYLYCSSGFGGGIYINGKLWRGAFGNAGEFGGMLDNKSFGYPSLESLRKELEKQGEHYQNIIEMIDLMPHDTVRIEAWLKNAQACVSNVVTALSVTLDPQAIILGGDIPPWLAKAIFEGITIQNSDRRNYPRPLPKLEISNRSKYAASLGAALIPINKYYF